MPRRGRHAAGPIFVGSPQQIRSTRRAAVRQRWRRGSSCWRRGCCPRSVDEARRTG